MTFASLPTYQERGRNTVQRLLDAAERTLESDGLEGATIPAIAAQAGMSVGNVYKRFRDKDSLLQTVYERFFLDSFAANEFALDPAKWEGAPTPELLANLVTGMIEAYRARRSLVRALLLYAQTHPDPAFRSHSEQLRLQSLELFERLLRDRRADVGHPHPERAIRFVVMLIGHALETAVLSEAGGGLSSGDFLSHPAETATELSRIVYGYLRVRRTEHPRALSHSRRSLD
jgi:AcrR family transcriptional regulator